jgi:glycine cleavage system H protein
MAELRYTKDHESLYIEGDVARVGITAYAREALGDLVYIELPEVGREVAQGGELAVVESVKTAAEVYAPVGGTVIAVNEALARDLDKIGEPLSRGGWIVKIRIADHDEIDALMDQAEYDAYAMERC